MQPTRTGATNVRFASETGSRRTTFSEAGISRISSAHASSVVSSTQSDPPAPSPAPLVLTPPAPASPVPTARHGKYEIWEPPDEAVLDHYSPLPSKPTGGARLGKVIGAALRAQFHGKPFESPRVSLLRTRSVLSESDASTISRDELLQDSRRLGLPVRTPQPAPPPRPAIVQRPRTTTPRLGVPRVETRSAPPAGRPAAPPAVLSSRTMATALDPSPANSWGAPPAAIRPSTYKVWRASIGRARPPAGASPYTKMIDDAAYKPKPIPPAGTIVESSGVALARAERALYAEHSLRPVEERIFWTMPPDHDERVRNRIKAVDAMSRELALYGLDQYLAYGVKGAVMTNAGYHAPEWPESPAYDWITFEDARRTFDKTLQESIAYSDPGLTTIVFIFLLSRSGESMAIWRRKFTVPPSERLRRDLDLRKAALESQKRGQIYSIDLTPPTPIEDELIVVMPEKKKKRRKFPWFKIDWS